MFDTLRRGLSRLMAPVIGRFRRTTVMAFQIGFLIAIGLEMAVGANFASLIGFRKIPKFFGLVDILEPFSGLDFSGILAPFFPSSNTISQQPILDSLQAVEKLIGDFISSLFYHGARNPGFLDILLRVLIYDVVIFVIPTILIALVLRGAVSWFLDTIPRTAGIVLYLILLYTIIMLWGNDGGSRQLILIYMGINIMLTVSLNLVNGYMGEFSVGHAGFMGVGAYMAAVLSMRLFTNSSLGPAALGTDAAGPIAFIGVLIAGGIAAAIVGLLVAFPSFRTRGDYLAIVTLAVNFIVQGVINNMEALGGARGLNGVPLWTDLTWIFVCTLLSIFAIYALVNSTFGKGIVAIREDEIAANLMGVPTRRLKLVAFLVSSFIAGVAGALFAHQLAYVNPGNFGILKSTEALVMVYLGGMGSVSGSIIGAGIFTILIEALRPLAVLKWVVVPLILIMLMIFRPQGMFGFREMKLNLGLRPAVRAAVDREASDAAATD